jgi:hypothetical protein
MVTQDELCRVSGLTDELVAALFETAGSAECFLQMGSKECAALIKSESSAIERNRALLEFAEAFADGLREIEVAAKNLEQSFSPEIQALFAEVNNGTVKIVGHCPSPSAHWAIFNEYRGIRDVLFAVLRAAEPARFAVGSATMVCYSWAVKWPVTRSQIIKYIDVAMAAYDASFSSADKLSEANALKEQELARALRNAEPVAAPQSEGRDNAEAAGGNKIDAKPWPPDGGWHVESGAFWFRNKRTELTGKPLDLLQVFVRSREHQFLNYDHLRSAWPDESTIVSEATIRSHLSALRKALRAVCAAEGIDCQKPIPISRDAGWKFALPRH